MTQAPSAGDSVHYVPYATPDRRECQAATVTEVDAGDYIFVDLRVPDSTGDPVKQHVICDMRYGYWDDEPVPSYRGGTWHWPERVV